jgi:hypothetical protein
VKNGCFLGLKTCSKGLGAVFRGKNPWEKSMLSIWVFLAVRSPDCGRYSFGNVDGAESLD